MRYREISGDIKEYREISEGIGRNFASAGDFLPLAGDRESTPEIGSLPLKSGGLEPMHLCKRSKHCWQQHHDQHQHQHVETGLSKSYMQILLLVINLIRVQFYRHLAKDIMLHWVVSTC